MRIVFDLQGAQSEGSRRRGIGRYSMSLLRAILRNPRGHEILVLLNGSFSEAVLDIRRELAGLLPPENISVWYPAPGSAHMSVGGRANRIASEFIREAAILGLNPDFVILSSLFEGMGDDVATSVGRLKSAPTAVVLYDLIPYIYADIYLSNEHSKSWYGAKMDNLRRADLLLSISEATRNDAIKYTDFDKNKVITISTGSEDIFKRDPGSDEEWSATCAKLGIDRDFILYTGGIDHRKNVDRLIAAFAALPKKISRLRQLVIVCKIEDHVRQAYQREMRRLGLAADAVIFTGFVPHDELVRLYSRCDVFVFPSWYEGFGLPVLEAMQCGAVAIGSNVSSIPEAVGFEEALFNPWSVEAIAKAIVRASTDQAFRAAFRKHAGQHIQKFSWDRTAREALGALELAALKAPTVVASRAGRPRLAYISPIPPLRSGIAQFSAELLPDLATHYDIEVVAAGPGVPDWHAALDAPVRTPAWFKEHRARYDRILYHFGNSEFHSHMFELLAEVPGVVVLHDFYVSGILYHVEYNQSGPRVLRDAILASHGYADLAGLQKNPREVVERLPANHAVISQSLATIVHSQHAVSLAREHYGDQAAEHLSVTPLAQARLNLPERAAARQRLGLAPDEFVLCSFGLVHERKRSPDLLKAWIRFSRLVSNAGGKSRLIFAGSAAPDYAEQMYTLARKAGVSPPTITGWVSDADFQGYLAAADVAVQLRASSRGETSKSVLECLAAGLPTIVNANGSMAELPDDCVRKLPDEVTVGALASCLADLHTDAVERARLADAGFRYVREVHSTRAAAESYHRQIEAAYASSANSDAALVRWAELAPTSNADVVGIARAFARTFRPAGWRPQRLVLVSSSNEQASVIAGAFAGVDTYRVEPVYVDAQGALRYAREMTCRALALEPDGLRDDPVDFYPGDVAVLPPDHLLPPALLRDLEVAGVTIVEAVAPT